MKNQVNNSNVNENYKLALDFPTNNVYDIRKVEKEDIVNPGDSIKIGIDE